MNSCSLDVNQESVNQLNDLETLCTLEKFAVMFVASKHRGC